MAGIIVIVLFLAYFLTGTHRKVLAHFGLTDRDDNLMWMGFWIASIINGIVSLCVGVINPMSILWLGLAGVFVWMHYRRL